MIIRSLELLIYFLYVEWRSRHHQCRHIVVYHTDSLQTILFHLAGNLEFPSFSRGFHGLSDYKQQIDPQLQLLFLGCLSTNFAQVSMIMTTDIVVDLPCSQICQHLFQDYLVQYFSYTVQYSTVHCSRIMF